LDGDRGGDLDLKKLLVVADIDYVSRAEKDKEVEELTKKQIFKALRERVPVDQLTSKGEVKPVEDDINVVVQTTVDDRTKNFLSSLLDDLIGTRAAYVVDKELQIVSKVPISEIGDIVGNYNNIFAIVFDGKINQSIIDVSKQHGIKFLVGMGFKEHVDSEGISVLTMKDFR
jgi:DNA primase